MADRSVRVRLEAITHQYDRRISESAVLTNKFASELESADGRMANIVQSALALAPALVPLGAAGIPAIAGLTAQLGFAVLGTGALVLGLHDVGDTLKALNQFQLNPTQQNLAKLEQQFNKLGPAGGDFVLFLDHLMPRLHRLQALAEQGLLPGVEDGITRLLRLMPRVREMVFNLSSTGGDLIREAGDSLDDPRWQQFFDFLQTRARPTLTEMGQTAGNFALAFANLVRTFDPLEQDFSRGLLHMSEQIRDWSDGLEQSTGFQDLVDYVRENGPKALDTLAAFGDALVQIVEAAAPVGSVALPVLTELLKVVGAIADTPVIGSGLVGLAAAIGIYGRSLALLKTVGLRGNEGILGATFAGAKDKIRDAATALTAVTTAQDRARLSASELAAVEERRATALREGLVTAGKGAALAAGFAVAQTGLADSMGLTNTASLALIGTVGGPWGVALGAATGFVLDLTHANDDLEDSIKQVNAAAQSGDFAQWRAALQDVLDKNKKLQADAKEMKTIFQTDPITFTKEGFGQLGKLIGINPAEDAQKEADKQADAFAKVRKNAVDLFAALNGANPRGLKVTDDELTSFITKISPALQRAGVDIDSLLQHRKGWFEAQLAVRDWVEEMDSAHGRSQAVADALAQLDDQITPTVDAAKALADALDALFGPELNQAEATDRWIESLKNLRSELKKNKDGLTGESDGALKNRAAIRDSVEALLDRAKADAAAGVSADVIVRRLERGRDAILEQATAAGKSATEVRRYLNQVGLSAANLATIAENAAQKVQNISAAMRALKDKTVTIKIKEVMDAQANALGGIRHYAQGDVANRHMPELAGPGTTRIWREPETQGEAYIPLANDFRRPRAIDIWERTGIALGVQFRRYALGGGTGLLAGGGEVRLAQGDIDRIVRGLATIRPVVGQMTVQPHNYSEFLRQQDALTRDAAIGGSPR